MAGDTDDAIILEHAWSAAQAEFDLAKIRRIKVALIERVRAFGQFGVPQPVFPRRVTWRFLEPMIAGNLPRPFDAASTMRITEPEQPKRCDESCPNSSSSIATSDAPQHDAKRTQFLLDFSKAWRIVVCEASTRIAEVWNGLQKRRRSD
jgi:hypothetical protein